jgi:hypothetical protein
VLFASSGLIFENDGAVALQVFLVAGFLSWQISLVKSNGATIALYVVSKPINSPSAEFLLPADVRV